ncbi:Hypothetical protein UVM_LOCUS94 [uncultured virus]|nr:Hypothetical protein UVM_LOCUS94 [uncultured virus]
MNVEDDTDLGSVQVWHRPPLGLLCDLDLCEGNLFVQAQNDPAASWSSSRSWRMFDLLHVHRSPAAPACARKRKKATAR